LLVKAYLRQVISRQIFDVFHTLPLVGFVIHQYNSVVGHYQPVYESIYRVIVELMVELMVELIHYRGFIKGFAILRRIE